MSRGNIKTRRNLTGRTVRTSWILYPSAPSASSFGINWLRLSINPASLMFCIRLARLVPY